MKQRDAYSLHADVCAVFSNPARLQLLDLLAGGEMTVGDLAKRSSLGQANVSQHLAIMRYKGVVKARKDGKNVYYRVADARIVKAFRMIRGMVSEKFAKGGRIE